MKDTQRIDTEAAHWAVRLHTAEVVADAQRELTQWLDADVRHRGALLRAQAIWHDFDRLAALAAGKPFEKQTEKRWKAWASVAAVLALVTLAAGALYFWPAADHYTTSAGGLDNVRLADGSHVALNADTSIRVRFEDHRRQIQLDKGEAVFQVSKDPGRPFIVRAGSVSVRAIGTVFAVRSVDRRVDVTVTEGLVELVDDSGTDGPIVRRVAANEQATVMEARRVDVQRLSHEATERQLAWRGEVTYFNGESLSAAVAEMNRHNRRQIVIDNPALAARPVVGAFRVTDPDNFAATVAVALGAQSIGGESAIYLR